ncbi:MAG TPA: histidine kinase [Candidatus Limnocylindrales bacterium]|nr:histidine kinase [Candidatus Limnocylindrales bacterium]
MTASTERPVVERLLLLSAAGIGLAAIQQFGPFLWPYEPPQSLSIMSQAWFFVVELLWVAAMLVTYRRNPTGPMWKLFLLYQVVGAIGVIWVIPTSLTWLLSQASIGIGSVVFVHLVLAFPSGRLTDRYDRAVVTAAYVFILLVRLAWIVVWSPPIDPVGFSPRNPYVLWPNAELAQLFGPGAIVAMAPFLYVAVIAGLVRHWRRASPAVRRALLPIIIAAPLQLAITLAWHLVDVDTSSLGILRAALEHPIVGLAGLVFPVGFLLGLLRTRLARGSIAELALELGRGVPLGGLRETLARALRDPTLVLAYPAASGAGYVGPDGQAIEVPGEPAPDRGIARLERDGETLAILAYDPALDQEDPGRVSAVASMARMALENERLAAQVRAQLDEVRASRARIVEAGNAERRRIERDLHDGAQQRLVALAIRLDQARAGSTGAATLIDETTAELLLAVREVRDLARGLHPTILTDAGLAAAVEALAERTPFPVTIAVTDARFPAEIEAAAYYVVAEGLTNIARYAGATDARVEATAKDGQLIVTVTDHGKGGADPSAGTGLRGLVDRLAAIDGELEVTSKDGEGTQLKATLPASL